MKKRAVDDEVEERLSVVSSSSASAASAPEDKKPGGMGKDIAEPTILEQFAADKSNFEEQESSKLPKWLYKYLVFRFNLLDRVGNFISRPSCFYVHTFYFLQGTELSITKNLNMSFRNLESVNAWLDKPSIWLRR